MSNLNPAQKLFLLVILWLVLSGHPTGGDTAPYVSPEFTVLMLTDSEAQAKLTTEQLNVLQGTAPGTVLAYLTAKGGKHRVMDADNQDMKFEADWVKAARAVALADKPHLPSLVAAHGKLGVKPLGPITTTADTLKLLEPLGGK